MNLISLLFHDVYVSDPQESGFPGSAADRYKIDATNFDKHLAALDKVLTLPPVIVTEATESRTPRIRVAITVNDGGISYDSIIAPRLEYRGWRGHCFVTTDYIGRRGFLAKHHLRDLHARGHLIGSHSVTHRSHMATCDPKILYREWEDSRKTLEDILGVAVNCASVPGGYYAPRVARAASEAGLNVLFTSEPDASKHYTENCLILGRFTVRHGQRSEYVERLATGYPAALYREKIIWDGKKTLKALFRSGYPIISEYVHRIRQDGNKVSEPIQLKSFSKINTSAEEKR